MFGRVKLSGKPSTCATYSCGSLGRGCLGGEAGTRGGSVNHAVQTP